MANRVLVVDDEKLIVKGLKFSLEQDGMEVECAYDGEEALECVRNNHYDIILLDIMLPKLDGMQVCQQIREFSSFPVIMLTAKGDDMDKILGLEYGADDYVTKPFNNDELLARIRVHLKHSLSDTDDVIRFEDIELDPRNYKVVCKGVDIPLSKIEFEILKVLMKNSNQVVTKSTLFDTVWDTIDSADENTLNVHMSKIRNKLKKANPNKDYIETIWSIGYKFKN